MKFFPMKKENQNYPEKVTQEIMKSIPTNCKLTFNSKLFLFHKDTLDQSNSGQINELKDKINSSKIKDSNIVESKLVLNNDQNNLLINRKSSTQPINKDKYIVENQNKSTIDHNSPLIVSKQAENKFSNTEPKYKASKFQKEELKEFHDLTKIKETDEFERLTLIERFNQKSCKLKEQTVVVRRKVGEETSSKFNNNGQNIIERKITPFNNTISSKNITPKKKYNNKNLVNPNNDQTNICNLGKFYTPKKSSHINLKNGNDSNQTSIQQNSSKNIQTPCKNINKMNDIINHFNSSNICSPSYHKKKYVRQVNKSPLLSYTQKGSSTLLYSLNSSHEMLSSCENKHFLNSRFNYQN